jgi:hypothetical protein
MNFYPKLEEAVASRELLNSTEIYLILHNSNKSMTHGHGVIKL